MISGAEYLGWSATAVFVGSYFFTRPQTLKRVQMAGALMWTVYGLLIGASPVVVANLLVFGAAAWTLSARQSPVRDTITIADESSTSARPPSGDSGSSHLLPPTSSRCLSRSAGSS